MIRLIMQKELREIIGSTKFAITFGVCSLLIVLSFYVGARNYQVWERQYEAAKRETLRQMDGLTDWFAVQQNKIYLPPQPLAALVSGVSNDIGRTTEVHGRGELTADDSRFNEDPIFAVFRFLDLEFIFQIVISLFAILFAYDAICGEKEAGTLKLSFASAIPKDKYILGKLFGSYIALGLPLLIPVLLGCMLLFVFGIPFSGDEWVRLCLIVAAGFLYFGVFLTMSIFVSSLTRRSSSAFLMLLVAWIFAVLIIPRIAVLIAGRAVDVPSVDEIASQKVRFNSQLWNEDRKKMADYKPSTTDNDMEKTMQQFNEFMQTVADERDKKMQEFTERLNEDRENRQRVQQQLSLGLARISPAAAFSLAVTTLAGTALTLENHYKDAASSYQKVFANFMKQKTGMVTGGRVMMFRSVVENGEKPEPINPHELPEFTYQPMTLNEVFGASVLNLGLLVFFNMIFFLGSYLAFLRYDVR
jgi:ABC-type transport system involved in multi-copper enzyme maturation permease subunit